MIIFYVYLTIAHYPIFTFTFVDILWQIKVKVNYKNTNNFN